MYEWEIQFYDVKHNWLNILLKFITNNNRIIIIIIIIMKIFKNYLIYHYITNKIKLNNNKNGDIKNFIRRC